MEALKLLSNFGIRPRGIIHVGANYGQEFDAYRSSLAETVLYIEPISRVFESLRDKVEQEPGHHAIRAVCSDKSGEVVTFNIASNSCESSSMLELGNHAKLYPNIVYVEKEQLTTQALDDLLSAKWADHAFNLLVIDTQGADLLVLKGATDALREVEAVYVEVAEVPLYENGCTWPEIADFLGTFGFSLKYMSLNPKHWGNAFFIRNEATFSMLRESKSVLHSGYNLALGKPARQISRYRASKRYNAGNGVNGVKTGSFGFHTALEKNPWWQVDLQERYLLTEVCAYNRLDAATARAYGFVLRVSLDGERWQSLHRQEGRAFGGVDVSPARIGCDRAPARYVRIELEGEGYLHLDEVEVYGEPIDS